MRPSPQRSFAQAIGSWPAIAVVSILILAGFTALGVLRQPITKVSGDEGTFLAMTASLALDRDLVFTEPDRERAESAGVEGGRQAIILQRTDKGLSYSKPVLYPVLSAALYPLLGDLSLVAVNLVAIGLAIFLMARFLVLLGEPVRAGWTLVTFVGASVVLAYSAYMMSDMIQVSLTLAGAVLCLAGIRSQDARRGGAVLEGSVTARLSRIDRILVSRLAPLVGGLCLGLAGAVRYPNLLIPVGIGVALVAAGSRRSATAVAVGAALAFFGLSLANYFLGGSANPYKAERTQFTHASGYAVAPDEPLAEQQFQVNPARQIMTAVPRLQPALTAYSTLYFLIGRHTSLLFYFPAVIAIGWSLARSRDRVSLILVLTVLAGAAFYLVWEPRNYFGGGTFVGNRYFLPFYALFMLATRALPRRRELVATWVVALLTFSSALASVAAAREFPTGSQNHVTRGIFPWLPYETTARSIEGPPVRYWSGDYLKITTPFARTWDSQVLLKPGAPATEIMIATTHPDEDVAFVVSSFDRPVELEVDNGREVRRFLYEGRRARGVTDLLTVEGLRTWRRHPFRWHDSTPFYFRFFRVKALLHHETRVELRYLGTTLEGIYEYELLGSNLRGTAVSGEVQRVTVTVTNRSGYPWTEEGVIPVSVVHAVFPRGGGEIPRSAWTKTPLPRDIASEETVKLELDLLWPEEPGEYMVVVDLQYGSIPFVEKVGSRLLESEVLVSESSS